MTTPQTRQGGSEIKVQHHVNDELIRSERLPNIWCPGCGIGIVVGAYVRAIQKSTIPRDRQISISGIGCTGRVSGYLNLDSYHTTHGRAVAFATGMAVARPELEITVVAGDGDLGAIGGNHLIHAARRNVDLNVIMVNNFNYGMTGGQHGGTTPFGAKTHTSPYGNVESPFNVPYLVAAAGASFVSRWTALHVRQITAAIRRMMEVKGFAFMEVISPCPPTFGEFNGFPDPLDMMKYFRDKAVVDHRADLSQIGMTARPEDSIVVGNFVDRRRTTYQEALADLRARVAPQEVAKK
ncbi:MAG: 2-oxoacid:ferredoxin oxidoreductase subunit beta [Nitrososphaerota archaeon]|nr:2-oxoacid:ferredoxin oxidoreductase subunit beta [Nitrososphaerota archaeon]